MKAVLIIWLSISLGAAFGFCWIVVTRSTLTLRVSYFLSGPAKYVAGPFFVEYGSHHLAR
jgi:hypothetical protein